MVSSKGVGDSTPQSEQSWLIQDMSDELKSWGHSGGPNSSLILKCDSEPAIKSIRDTLGKFHGGQIIPEHPPKGESAANGRVEQAGQVIRGVLRVYKEAIEEKAETILKDDDAVIQ